MKNLFLQLGSWWRYFTNVPPKQLDYGTPSYQLPIGHDFLIKEDWHLDRPWGALHLEQNASVGGMENFYISEGCIELKPDLINIYTWKNNRTDMPVDWVCGCLWSKIEFGYGYSEVAVKMEGNIGMWNGALWMIKEHDGVSREIDVNESYVRENGKHSLCSAMHFYGDRKSHIAKHHPLREPFHRTVRFGVFREPNWASIMYDGHLVRREKIDTPPRMPAIIGTGMKTGVKNSKGGVMKVYSFKHWEL